jgi:hypothetical protein
VNPAGSISTAGNRDIPGNVQVVEVTKGTKIGTSLLTLKNAKMVKTRESILQSKLDDYVAKRLPTAEKTLKQIEQRAKNIIDVVAPQSTINFAPDRSGGGVVISAGEDTFKMHSHALGQFCERYKVPAEYLKRKSFGQDWEKEMISEVMNTEIHNQSRDRVLLRSHEDRVYGFLSTVYKRYNSMMLYATFLAAAKSTDAIVTAGYFDDTRDYVEVLKPKIAYVETKRNGTIPFSMGSHLGHSDFGDGALSLRQFLLIVTCLNGNVGRQVLREVHLGRQIQEEYEASERTIKLDTELKCSMITDVMSGMFNDEEYEQHVQRIVNASDTLVKNVDDRIKTLSKVGITQDEQKALSLILMNGSEEDGVQGDMTLWKFAQGISALARTPGLRRSVDLMEVAGNLIYN